MRALLVTAGFVVTLFSGAVYAAQAPAAKAPTPPPAQPSAQTPAEPAPDPYTYEAQGRRDPFVTPLGTGMAERAVSKQGAGPAGMATFDISVRGVMQSKGAYVALIKGVDAKTYVVRAGDRLLDGVIKAVGPDGLTIVQDVNDPLSLVKTREVRKSLRSKEDGKP